MGAHTFSQVEIVKGNCEVAYNQAVNNAVDEYGDNSYNGTISTTHGVLLVEKPKGTTFKRFINEQLELTDKWGPARCVELTGDAAVKERKRFNLKGRVFVLFGHASS